VTIKKPNLPLSSLGSSAIFFLKTWCFPPPPRGGFGIVRKTKIICSLITQNFPPANSFLKKSNKKIMSNFYAFDVISDKKFYRKVSNCHLSVIYGHNESLLTQEPHSLSA
jgi:hypothetical protein